MRQSFLCPICGNELEQRLISSGNICKYCGREFSFAEIIKEKKERKGKNKK